MRWCRGDIRRQIEFFDPSVTIAPRALINPPFRGGSCPKSVTHVSLLICYPCPPTIPFASEESLLGKTQDPQLVKEYRQRNQALSQLENREVKPTEITDKDIQELTGLIQAGGEKDLLIRRLNILEPVI